MNLGTIRLLVTHFEACFHLYRDVLGLTPTWGDATSDYASFQCEGGTLLAIFRRELQAVALGTAHLPLSAAQQDPVLIPFPVEDLEAAFSGLTARGGTFISPPRDYPDWTLRAAYLRDPAGNLIEVSTGLDKSKWFDRVKAEALKDDHA